MTTNKNTNLKFLAFGDLHADVYTDAEVRLEKIIESAKKNEVDFIVSLGDLCPPNEENKWLLNKLSDSGLSVYYTIGNHDTEHCKIEDTLAFFGLKRGFYSFVIGEYKFIVLDDCYYKTEEGDEHFPNSERKPCIYPVVPDVELKWLESELQDDKKFIVFSHISLVHGFEARGIRNRDEILKLFENREVLLCMNGHNHGDDIKIINDTLFYTVNASTGFSWWGNTGAGFTVLELPYADPLHVIVELQNGNVRINGMQSYYTEKKPEEVGVVDNVWKGISTLPRTSSYNVQ